MKNNLINRLFDFTVRTIRFMRSLPDNPENRVVRFQLAKSASSCGANYEE